MQDIDELRKNSNFQNIDLCDKELTFFYDEAMNAGKFWLTQEGINNKKALTHDFVLAGIMYEKEPEGIEDLFKKLNLQAGELKYANYTKNKSIEKIISSKRVTLILDWILNNNVYIHYTILNFLYYGLVDIIDSIIPENLINMIFDLKTTLYEYCKLNLDELFIILYKYSFPNIKQNEVGCFCHELVSFLSNKRMQNSKIIYLEIIKKLLLDAADTNNLNFIQNNEDNILVDKFFHIYQKPCYLFMNSFHHFDNEEEVKKKWEQFPLEKNGRLFINYDFLDSTESKYIQISDTVAGLLSDFFYFLDTKSIAELKNMKDKILLSNIDKINKCIKKSDKYHQMLLCNINDLNISNERYYKLDVISDLYYRLESKRIKTTT